MHLSRPSRPSGASDRYGLEQSSITHGGSLWYETLRYGTVRAGWYGSIWCGTWCATQLTHGLSLKSMGRFDTGRDVVASLADRKMDRSP